MQRSVYHKKYLQDIKGKVDITPFDVFQQIKADYGVVLPEDVDKAQASLKEIGDLLNRLIRNRKFNDNEQERIMKEYFYRVRIAKYFPKAYTKSLEDWEKEKIGQVVSSEEWKEAEKVAKAWREGRHAQPKDTPFKKIFGNLVEELGGDN